MINEIKKELETLKGKKLKLKVDVGRNKIEKYIGYIDKTYQNIWTFKTDEDLKSFSYNDILIRQVIISLA